MPLFDYHCVPCNVTEEHFVHQSQTPVPCGVCGGPTERQISRISVIPDSVPGGFVIENLHKTPKRYYSKSEYRDDLRAAGCRIRDHHVQTAEGGDRNPNCGSKWY